MKAAGQDCEQHELVAGTESPVVITEEFPMNHDPHAPE